MDVALSHYAVIIWEKNQLPVSNQIKSSKELHTDKSPYWRQPTVFIFIHSEVEY